MSYQLTAQDVCIIARTARSSKERTRREAWFLLALTDRRLKAAAAGELVLAAEVRLPLTAVVSLLWRIRRTAKAQWAAAKAAEADAEQYAAEWALDDPACYDESYEIFEAYN